MQKIQHLSFNPYPKFYPLQQRLFFSSLCSPNNLLALSALKCLKPTRCTPVANYEMRLCEIQRYFTDDTVQVIERGVEVTVAPAYIHNSFVSVPFGIN